LRQAYGGRCPAVMRPATRSGREPGSRFIPAGATGSWAGRGGGPRERILIAAKLGVRGAKGSRANRPATPPIDFQEGCPRSARQNPRLRRYEPRDSGEEPEPAHPNRRGARTSRGVPRCRNRRGRARPRPDRPGNHRLRTPGQAPPPVHPTKPRDPASRGEAVEGTRSRFRGRSVLIASGRPVLVRLG
jgi:hypothetical protein